MLGKKLLALVMAFAMVMSTAAVVFADDEAPAGADPSVVEQETPEAPAAKVDQVIKVDAEKTVVVGRAGKIAAKLDAGDGALSYASSDKTVVSVDEKGTFKAKAIGTAVITITAAETDKFNPAVAEIKVNVVPKAVTITSLVCKKHGKFTVKWNKLKGVDGFEIQFCKAKNFKKAAKIKSVKNGKATGATVKNKVLKKKARFYVRIRVYKTVNGVKYYSAWSGIKAVKIK